MSDFDKKACLLPNRIVRTVLRMPFSAILARKFIGSKILAVLLTTEWHTLLFTVCIFFKNKDVLLCHLPLTAESGRVGVETTRSRTSSTHIHPSSSYPHQQIPSICRAINLHSKTIVPCLFLDYLSLLFSLH